MRMNLKNIFCHRRPERSFFFRGHQFPVCARCTGIYFAAVTSLILINYIELDYNIFTLLIGILLFIPSAIDGGIQYLTDYESTNTKRLITGLLNGLGTILVYLTLFYLLFGIK